MPAPRTVKTTWADQLTRFGRTMLYVQSDATDEEIVDLMDVVGAVSVAHRVRIQVADTINGPDVAAGAAGAYSGHRDYVTFWMQSSGTSVHPVSAMSPSEDIFLDDNESVDHENAWVDAAVTELIAIGATKTGASLTGLKFGRRWMQEE